MSRNIILDAGDNDERDLDNSELDENDDDPMEYDMEEDEEQNLNNLIDSKATERNIYITTRKTNYPDNQTLTSTQFRMMFCVIHRVHSHTADSTISTEAQILCTCHAFHHPFDRFASADEAKAVVASMFSDFQQIPFSFDTESGQSLHWKELTLESSASERYKLQGFHDVVAKISEAAVRVVDEASASGRRVVEMAVTIDKRTAVPHQDFQRLIPHDVELSGILNHDDPELYLAIQQDYFFESALQQSAFVPSVMARSRVGDVLEDVLSGYISDEEEDDDDDEQPELNRAIGQSFLESEAAFGSVPAAKSAVEALEKFKYERRSEDESTCVICMEGVMIGSQLTRMPCSHYFHEDCILQWLHRNHTCPICRFELPSQ